MFEYQVSSHIELSFLLHFLLPGNKRQSKMAAGEYEYESNDACLTVP